LSSVSPPARIENAGNDIGRCHLPELCPRFAIPAQALGASESMICLPEGSDAEAFAAD